MKAIKILKFHVLLFIFNLIRVLWYSLITLGVVASLVIYPFISYNKWDKFTDYLVEDSDEVTIRITKFFEKWVGIDD